MNEIADRYRRRAETFEAKVAAVRPEQWSSPSPCAQWDARDVVAHIVDMHAVILGPLGRALSPAPSVKEDPLAAFRAARADIEALLADPDLAATVYDTPAGRMSAARHVDQVPSADLPLHGWDLAKATGQDATIDAEDLRMSWESVSGLPPDLLERFRTPGAFGPGVEVFGPEVEVAPDAPLQDRLLGLIGRDPHWTA
ncbi:TIGR03086 family metal-binding protein [Nonomuraea typhae]|uniref:TIGR03086 family metal-binding protein n=1 Tax=Nonomuraea typhae TaxID=2603600 RepID=A0ABW7YN42_9ACTN